MSQRRPAAVVFIAGIAQAAKRGILIKGSGPLEALARAHTVMFDKTGTLTVGGARLVAIEAAPGHSTNEILQIAGSLEQASHHVVAAAIVEAAAAKGLKLSLPSKVREAMGSGRRHARRTIDTRGFASNGVRAAQAGSVGGARAAWALSVFVAVDGQPIGAIMLADELRRETPRAVQSL